jgi:hypothetical protein
MVISIQQRFLMSKSFVPAVVAALALALGSVPVSVSASEAAKPSVSPASAKTLKAAKDAADAKNFGETIAKAQETLASPKKTPYDTYVAYQLLAFAYAQQGNAAEVIKAFQGQIDTGVLSPADVNKATKTMAGLAYQQKNYTGAIEYGNRLIRAGGAEADTYTLVGQSYYLLNKYSDATKFLEDFVGDQERRGAAPKEQTLVLLRSSYEKMQDKNGAIGALEKLVVYYPKADYWDNLLYVLRRDPKITERQTLHVYRLMQATGTLKQAADFTEMADLANNAGMPGEAQRVLEAGIAANAFTQQQDKDRATRLMGSAKRQAEADKAGLAKLEGEARSAKTGDLDSALGMSLFGHGDYPKSVEALSRALGKGGLKNPIETQVMLGVAQLRAGAKADGLKTFKSVKTDDTVMQRISKLWALYAS